MTIGQLAVARELWLLQADFNAEDEAGQRPEDYLTPQERPYFFEALLAGEGKRGLSLFEKAARDLQAQWSMQLQSTPPRVSVKFWKKPVMGASKEMLREELKALKVALAENRLSHTDWPLYAYINAAWEKRNEMLPAFFKELEALRAKKDLATLPPLAFPYSQKQRALVRIPSQASVQVNNPERPSSEVEQENVRLKEGIKERDDTIELLKSANEELLLINQDQKAKIEFLLRKIAKLESGHGESYSMSDDDEEEGRERQYGYSS